MASPVFAKDKRFNENGPTRFDTVLNQEQQGVMTIENTIRKTVGLFVILIIAAAVGWIFLPPIALLPLAIVGLALGLVNVFKKEVSPPLIIAYAAVQGLLLGTISKFYEASMPGIVAQAVLATFCVLAVVLALFANGKIRQTAKATKIFMVAIIGYLLFSVVNFVLMLTGTIDGMYGIRGMDIPGTNIPMGVPLGLLAILLASYSLVMDFTFIQQGEKNRLPEKEGWRGAFGLMVTIVWLYLEILRLIGIIRN